MINRLDKKNINLFLIQFIQYVAFFYFYSGFSLNLMLELSNSRTLRKDDLDDSLSYSQRWYKRTDFLCWNIMIPKVLNVVVNPCVFLYSGVFFLFVCCSDQVLRLIPSRPGEIHYLKQLFRNITVSRCYFHHFTIPVCKCDTQCEVRFSVRRVALPCLFVR